MERPRVVPGVAGREAKPNKKRDANEAEAAVVKKIKDIQASQVNTVARLQPNSGATAGKPGDAVIGWGTNEFLVDMKSTVYERIYVTVDMLRKIKSEAKTQNKRPLIILDYKNNPDSMRYFAVLPLNDLCVLLDMINQETE
jgi:Holliday junction resolvase